jgi:hypothetical protein
MYKGNYWDAITKQFYKWDNLLKLLKKRNGNTPRVSKKEK